MAIIVSDSFNRANNPTSMGTADTGQTWSQTSGTADWGINSNQSLFAWDYFEGGINLAVIETGFQDAITSVTLVNPTYPTLPHFGASVGVVCRYVDNNYYFRLIYGQFPGATALRLVRIYAGSTTTVIDVSTTLNIGDTIAVACCGSNFEIFLNGVSQGTYDDSAQAQNYGTKSGLVNLSGTVFFSYTQRFEDFLVETNGTCTTTYNCTASACVDPGDGTGTYATLAACLEGCAVAATYNCITNECVDPGDGTGTYSSLADCVASGCGGATVRTSTMVFDHGNGSSYYLVAPVVDSGDELRSKVIKAGRVTGKRTNQSVQLYTYDVDSEISVSDLENGNNSVTGVLSLTDNSNVSQSPRVQVNCPNAVLSTIRVQGDDTGETTRDRIDEIVMEVAEQGVRR